MNERLVDNNHDETIIPPSPPQEDAVAPVPAPEPSRHNPVIVTEKETVAFSLEKIQKQWLAITEIIKREITANPEVRRIMATFTSSSLDELLPSRALSALLPVCPRIADICNYHNEQLLKYLSLPEIPEDYYPKGLYSAPGSDDERIAEIRAYLAESNDEPDPDDRGALTRDEHYLIRTRYHFAREIEILALGAELHEHKESINPTESEISLPSGTRIKLNSEEKTAAADLLSPILWKTKESMYRHRSYVIEVNDHKYLLKERRTPKHDLKAPNNVLTSEEEFDISKNIRDFTTEQDLIECKWEKPIACVIYPGGYQFNVFKIEEELSHGWDEAADQFEKAVLGHKEQFQDIYQEIAEATTQKLDSPEIKELYNRDWLKKPKRGWSLRKIFVKNEVEPARELSFESFAMVLSAYLIRKSVAELSKIPRNMGYYPSDSVQKGFRIKTEPKVALEIIGFDIEHWRKIPEENADQLYIPSKPDFVSLVHSSIRGRKGDMEIAASLAILERWVL